MHQKIMSSKTQDLKTINNTLEVQKKKISEYEHQNKITKLANTDSSVNSPLLPNLNRASIRFNSNLSMSQSFSNKKHEWMDREVSKYVEQQATRQLMEKEILNRSQMLKRKEELIETRKTLSNFMSDNVRSSNLAVLQEGLDELNKQIEKKQVEYLRTSQVPLVYIFYFSIIHL